MDEIRHLGETFLYHKQINGWVDEIFRGVPVPLGYQTSCLWRESDIMCDMKYPPMALFWPYRSHPHYHTQASPKTHTKLCAGLQPWERDCARTLWLTVCVTVCVCACVHTCISASLCIGAFVSVCVCYSVLIWLCSQMTVPLYNMTLKCAKCGVISSADVSTTATSNAMLVPLIIFP